MLYYWSPPRICCATEVRQTDSLLLRSAKRILYYWSSPRRLFIIEVRQGNPVLLKFGKRIIYNWGPPRRFFTTEVRQADSLLWGPPRGIFSIEVRHTDGGPPSGFSILRSARRILQYSGVQRRCFTKPRSPRAAKSKKLYIIKGSANQNSLLLETFHKTELCKSFA